MPSTLKKIVLAIDPFERGHRLRSGMFSELLEGIKGEPVRLEVVYVRPSFPDPVFDAEEHKQAYDRLVAWVGDAGLGDRVGLEIIRDRFGGRGGGVRTLVEYLRGSGADLVLVSSRGRHWMSRMVLGSFAESLLLRSPIPVLFLGRSPIGFEQKPLFLYPTDFSAASKRGFLLFVRQIRFLDPELLILHVEQYPGLITGYSLTGVGAYLPEVYWKIQKESSLSEGELWAGLAQEAGVSARFLLEECGASAAHSIERVAQEQSVSLIGLVSVRSDLDRLLLGSISTRLFRASRIHVWVLGPTAEEMIRIREAEPQVKPPGLGFASPTGEGE